ncbi:MAG: AraC family transcriptional regulator, partial [Acidobacteria bacterium]
MDALSDVLRAVRLTGAVFFDVRASDPWVAETPPGGSIVGRMFPGAEHLISYHAVTSGACWACLDGEQPVRLSAGDVVVFPHGDAHALSSAPGMRSPADVAQYRRPSDGQLPFTMSVGGTDIDSAHFVCGFLGCDARPFNPLLAALPRVIHVSDARTGAIGTFVQFAVTEARERRPGGECVLGHLSELMFVDVVRRYVETLPADRTGWLAGLREPFVGRALAALHGSP